MFFGKKRQEDIADARARVRELERCIAEKRKPSESQAPPTRASRSASRNDDDDRTPVHSQAIGFRR